MYQGYSYLVQYIANSGMNRLVTDDAGNRLLSESKQLASFQKRHLDFILFSDDTSILLYLQLIHVQTKNVPVLQTMVQRLLVDHT